MKRLFALLLSLILCLSGCAAVPETPVDASSEAPETPAPKPDPTTSSAAADYMEGRLKEYDDTLYVYKDFADGANHYTQKAWMGDDYDDIPAMGEDAEGYDGISGIVCEIDLSKHGWGGYMFLNGILPEGRTEPLSDFGEHDAGLDLTGAAALTFYAKGETGDERVEFFMGGLGVGESGVAPYADTGEITLGYVTLSKTWERFEIPLDGLDLTRIGCGFGWVTNDSNNPDVQAVRFYVDEIRYEFAEDNITPLFLQSYASVKPGSDDAVINNFAYLYDQCAAAMALSYAGKHEDARRIADAIVYASEHDRYYTDGRLRNAYMSGNPKSFPGWFSARGEEFARMPGFYDTAAGAWFEDAYAASAGSTGNLAWSILALCEVYSNAPEREDYLDAAARIADFVLTLRGAHDGFAGGYEGWEGSEAKASYLSVEHNTDLIAAFGRLHELTGKREYADASASAKAFVLSMYDEEQGCFYTGTADDGVTANKEVIPLDCQTWTLLALGDAFKDGDKALRFVEENMAVGEGYDFNTDKDGVWFEGTAQVALAYLYAGNEAKYREILDALNANSLPDGSITAADRDGVTTGFTVSGTDIPWNYGKRVHVGATAWLAFAQMGRNPFAY
ncbi:MAG: hypothetical protein LBL63_06925 [Clostridiales Family XIII bacterium]|jgi:hypothetical protein|nr:hypothetical protein [Clostridiales Family XIII bacterium]